MSRVTRVLARAGLGMMVIGGLAFGATQALATAGPRECSLCDWPEGQEACDECCRLVLDFEGGTCFPSGNCVCY